MTECGVQSFCPRCGARAPGIHLRCPRCGGLTLLELPNPRWKVESSVPSIWRYWRLLPRLPRRVSLGEGLTPLRRVGGTLVKLESRNPTGSYADRASSLLASYLASKGAGRVSFEYSEDFAYSLAYYLRGLAEVEVVIPDPSRIDAMEVVALVSLGALVSFGRGSGTLSYASSLAVEGLKTIALELVERGVRAERVVVPAETGLLALSVWKGLRDAERAGAPAGYEVVAAALEGAPEPELARLAPGVRVERVGAEEAVVSLVELARRGIRAKLLAAAALAAAERLGGSVAVVTVSQRRAPPLRAARRSQLKEAVEKVLAALGEATAYDLWARLRGYSLRGVYRALSSLEREGRVCSSYRAEGSRKVKLYRLCAADAP
ncbi:MAG: pyridoxal-phosphate dependent enzyme [Thermoproteota archaeon]